MSDQSDCNVVVTIFVLAFFYLNYLRIRIDIKNDWNNIKCNPMNLWISSFFKDPKTANTDFNNCINSMSSAAIDAGLQTAYNKQQDAIDEIANQETNLNNYLSTFNNLVNGSGGLIDQYKINKTQLDDLGKKQTTYGTINELLETKTDNNSLYRFTDNVQTIFNNIKEYLPNLQILN